MSGFWFYVLVGVGIEAVLFGLFIFCVHRARNADDSDHRNE